MLLKVCCIQDRREMEMAAASGATHVGLVGAMPSGPGPIPDEAIARLVREAPPGVTPVLLTSRTEAPEIAAHIGDTGAPAVQIVSAVPAGVRHELRRLVPAVVIVQVVHVEGDHSVDLALRAADGSDYVLLDSGRPGAVVPELGGTGRIHDWTVSARIVSGLSAPVFLAGGLSPDNVATAVAEVGPAGVDLCSGVRDGDGRLDPERLGRFASAVLA